MLTIVEDGVLVVGDDPLLQLVHSPLFIDVDAFRDLVGEGGRRVRAWRTVTYLLCVLGAIQAVVSICGPGSGCRKIFIQQSKFLASLSAHIHTRDVLAHIRELLRGVCAARIILALEFYHHSSYYPRAVLLGPVILETTGIKSFLLYPSLYAKAGYMAVDWHPVSVTTELSVGWSLWWSWTGWPKSE